MAPRRAPVESIAPHMASQMSMNDTGPEAMAPAPFARVPLEKGGEVTTNAAALLHRHRALLQGAKDA